MTDLALVAASLVAVSQQDTEPNHLSKSQMGSKAHIEPTQDAPVVIHQSIAETHLFGQPELKPEFSAQVGAEEQAMQQGYTNTLVDLEPQLDQLEPYVETPSLPEELHTSVDAWIAAMGASNRADTESHVEEDSKLTAVILEEVSEYDQVEKSSDTITMVAPVTLAMDAIPAKVNSSPEFSTEELETPTPIENGAVQIFLAKPETLGSILVPGQLSVSQEEEERVLSPQFSERCCELEQVASSSGYSTENNISKELDPQRRVYVRDIQVLGSTVFSDDELEEIVRPAEGQQLTAEELRLVADRVTKHYLENEYITSRVIPLEFSQIKDDGIVIFQVDEGEVRKDDIEVKGLQRLREGYIKDRIALGTKVPLSTEDLEKQLKLLRSDPLLRTVEASLRGTGEPGRSKIIVRVNEADPFSSILSADNYSPPSVGGNRLSVSLRHRNVTGLGDEAAISYFRTVSGGTQVGDISYKIPVSSKDASIQFRFAPNRNRVIDPQLEDLDISGKDRLYSINYRHPLIRSPKEDLAFTLGLSHQTGQTFILDGRPFAFGQGPDEDGVSRTAVVQFGQDYTRRDPQGAWSFRSQFNLGTGWLNSTLNENPVPDGRFLSWQGQGQRIQRLNDNHLIIAQGSLQLATDGLLPSQQFVIGGGQSLRGYRQNARSADNGFRFSVEDRITVARDESGGSRIQVAPFWDIGAVWNANQNPNRLQSQRWLSSIGIGVIWQDFIEIKNLSLRLDYGLPLIRISDRGDSIQDRGLHFGMTYQF